MNVKHFYLESFVTLVGIFSYNFNKSANAHPKVWLHTLPMEASGMELNLASWVRAKDFRAVPTHHRRRREKETISSLVFAFPGSKTKPRRLAGSLVRRAGRPAGVEEETEFPRCYSAWERPGVPAASHRWPRWTPSLPAAPLHPGCCLVLETAGTDSPEARDCPHTHAQCCFLSRASCEGGSSWGREVCHPF